MRLFFYVVVAALLGAVGWFLVHIIPASGMLVDLEPVLVGECRRVEVAPGTEDVTIDPELGLAFISAADRRGWYNESGGAGVNPKNGIYTMSMDGSDTITLVSPPMEGFLPHGISLWRGEDGEKHLFVVNHPPSGGEFVEIFDIGEAGALTHLDSVSFDAMHSPNDVLGVGPRQFYATNDRGYEEGMMATLEAYMALPFSSLVYYDGKDGSIAAKHLTYANGVNMSADGKTVYVAEFLERRIAMFDRDAQTGALNKRGVLKVNTGPDNIEIAKDGALWVAGHTKAFEFLAHAKDAAEIAPSHVVRIDPQTGDNRDVFISTKGEINASSVGAVWDDTLIVGAVFDGHVMVCPVG